MTFTEGAKILTPEEIKEMINDETMDNVVINGMLFVETRGNDVVPSKVFPCYIYAWREEDVPVKVNPDGKPIETKKQLAFQADIIQFRNGEFGMLQVILHEDEFGVNKRIWDKPPTKSLRAENPFLETTVAQ